MTNNSFSIICLHVLPGCSEQYRKVLLEDEYYFFNDRYKVQNSSLVKENSSQIDSVFYGKNITVQAVVGKNGCGKSSIFELIYRLINNLSYVAVNDIYRANASSLYYITGIKAELYYELEGKLGQIRCIDDEVYFKYGDFEVTLKFPYYYNFDNTSYLDKVDDLDDNNEDIVNSKIVESILHDVLSRFFYTLVIDYSLQSLNPCDFENEKSFGDGLDDECYDSWIKSLYDKNDGYMVPIGFEPYRGRNVIDLRIQKELAEDRLAALLIDCRNKNRQHDIGVSSRYQLLPDYDLSDISFSIDYTLLHPKTYSDDDLTSNLVFLVKNPAEHKVLQFVRGYDLPHCEQIEETDLYRLGLVYLIRKTFQISHNYPNYGDFSDLEDRYCRLDEDLTSEDVEYLEELIEKIKTDDSHIGLKIKQGVNFLKILGTLELSAIEQFKEKFLLSDYEKTFYGVQSEFKTLNEILTHYPPSFCKHEILLTDAKGNDGIKFSNLSSGERQYAYSSSSYLYHLRNLISIHGDGDRIQYKNVCLILDEIELCFHPEYQRTYLSHLLHSIEQYKINEHLHICILLSTHSPFILSDILQSNVLMLEKGKPIREDDRFCTFGANIHDLLANRFFLNNGFMGDIAIEKIKGLSEQLQCGVNEDFDREYAEWLISKIGEPVIREQLMTMYMQKVFGNHREQKIQWLQSMINDLK